MAEIYKNNSNIQLGPKNVYINYSSPFNIIASQGPRTIWFFAYTKIFKRYKFIGIYSQGWKI